MSENRVTINIKDGALAEKINRAAKSYGNNRSAFITYVLERYFEPVQVVQECTALGRPMDVNELGRILEMLNKRDVVLNAKCMRLEKEVNSLKDTAIKALTASVRPKKRHFWQRKRPAST